VVGYVDDVGVRGSVALGGCVVHGVGFWLLLFVLVGAGGWALVGAGVVIGLMGGGGG